MIFVGGETKDRLDEVALTLNKDHLNASKIVDESFGAVVSAYSLLYWISWMLMIGVFFSVLIGSYLVRSKPVFLVAHFLITVIAIVLAAEISNIYGIIIQTTELASTFASLVGANLIMSRLPVWVAIIGVLGWIIMFISYVRGRDES